VAETHHCHATRTMMGFASLNPSYGSYPIATYPNVRSVCALFACVSVNDPLFTAAARVYPLDLMAAATLQILCGMKN